MNRFRLLAIAFALAVATAVSAQQPADNQPGPGAVATAPVDRHLALLAEKLDLSADQQERIRPILQRMHDASEAAAKDESISPQERNQQMHAQMMKADQQVRVLLTEEQKKKLDVMEQQMHAQGAAPQDQKQPEQK